MTDSDKYFISWVKATLIPDLHEAEWTETALDIARLIRIIEGEKYGQRKPNDSTVYSDTDYAR
jgi:hypothetical protein